MTVFLYPSCDPHQASILKALEEVRQLCICAKETFEGVKANNVQSLSPELEEIVTLLLGEDSCSASAGLRDFLKTNNTILFHLLDRVEVLPNVKLARNYTADRPVWSTRDYQGEPVTTPQNVTTADLLTSSDVSLLDNLKKPYPGATRAVIIRCVNQDASNQYDAYTEGCVVTLYPRLFKDMMDCISDCRPRATDSSKEEKTTEDTTNIDGFTDTLSTTLYHVLTHRCGTIDIKLLWQSIPPDEIQRASATLPVIASERDQHRQGSLEATASKKQRAEAAIQQGDVQTSKAWGTCYGHEACCLLALSAQSDEAINNAETNMFLALSTTLLRAYPELSIDASITYFPREDEQLARLMTTRWDRFRHESQGSVADQYGYDEEDDTWPARVRVEEDEQVWEPETGNKKDECWVWEDEPEYIPWNFEE